jgi:hypothetical protein
MTQRAEQLIALIAAMVVASAAMACDCLPADAYTDKDLEGMFAKADAIVHGRVLALTITREARITILETFKGEPSVLKARPGNHGNCGTDFWPLEEAIFVVYSGQVSLCGKLPARPALINRLRAYKR